MLKKETIELLRTQREAKYTFENTHKLDLTYELINNIGDPNTEIRDDLIYPCLAHLLHDKHFDEEILTNILNIFMSDSHLFFDLENTIENSVLKRSFTSLQIVILIYLHRKEGVFSNKLIMNTLIKYIDYFNQEEHYEGYNEKVGWLHSIAHSADVFDQFFQIEHFTDKEYKIVLEAILLKIKQRHYQFSHEEDERMIIGIKKLILRNILDQEYLIDYINRFSQYEKNSNFPEMYCIKSNVKNFLRSLYFALLQEEKYQNLTEKIIQVLNDNVSLK